MEHLNHKVAQLAGGEALSLLGRSARSQLFGFLDQLADDECLTPLPQPSAQILIGALALFLPNHPGTHRPAAGRQLAQGGDVKVAVRRQ